MKCRNLTVLAYLPLLVVAISCTSSNDATGTNSNTKNANITIAAYSVARPLYEKGLIPAFKAAYAKDHPGTNVDFTQTYEASGAQTRAILAGLKADVAALQVATEMDKIAAAGLADKNWAKADNSSVPATSVVVLEVRSGNPKGIKDWADLSRPDVQVVLPNPDTSGGAKYNVCAIDTWASAQPDELTALKNVHARIAAFGKSSKEAQQIFSSGQGDVLVGLECEAQSRKQAGDPIEIAYPSKTVETDPPVVALSQKGSQPSEVAVAFVKFLSTPDAQRIFAQNHFRPRDTSVAKEFASSFPSTEIVTIDQLGGWKKVDDKLFGDNGLWKKAGGG